MTNHQLCMKRDSMTVQTITDWGVLDTEQVKILLYPSYRVAQRRLQRLAEAKRIKRCDFTMPYSYYVDKPDNIVKRLQENWVRIWIIKGLRSWEQMVSYDYKTFTVKNTATGIVREMCVFDIAVPSIEKIREELRCASC